MGKPVRQGATIANPMLAELVVADSDEEDDVPTSSGTQIANPMLADGGAGDKKSAGGSAAMIEANRSAMTDEELLDLTYAFQAADMDGGGIIDVEEFELMLTVMGATITREQTMSVIRDAKQGFAAWKRQADEESVAMCRGVWEEFDADNSGTMDRKEITAVIEQLRSFGANPDPISEADMANGELTFDDFMAWYLKQDTLPDEFSAPDGSAPVGGLNKTKKKGLVRNGVQTALLPLRAVTKVASGPAQMLERSAKMITAKMKSADTPGEVDSDASELSAIEQAMKDNGQLIFAEFAFMVSKGMPAILS